VHSAPGRAQVSLSSAGPADLSLPPESSSVPRARHYVAGRLAHTEISDDTRDAAVLLTSELVTNAIVHARSTVRVCVRIDLERSVVRVGVMDASPDLPVARSPRRTAGGGRGIRLLGALSATWGASPSGTGKEVWFEIPFSGTPWS